MKPTATINVRKSAFQALSNFVQNVIDQMTAAIASFPTPIPALTGVQTDVDDLNDAITAWGPEGNRGSAADYINLLDAAEVVYNDALALQAYVQNTAQDTAGSDYVAMAAIIASSGFSLKAAPAPQGVLAAPNDFLRVVNPTVSLHQVALKWKKPAGLHSPGNVKAYQILRADINDFNQAAVIGTSTKTSFLDDTTNPMKTYYYWVRGVNTSGYGVESMVVQASTAA